MGLAEALQAIGNGQNAPAPQRSSGSNPFDAIFNTPVAKPKAKGGYNANNAPTEGGASSPQQVDSSPWSEGPIGILGNLLSAPEHLVTSAGITLGRVVGHDILHKDYGANNPSVSNFLQGIYNPAKEISGGDIIRGAPAKGLNTSLFKSDRTGTHNLIGLQPAPLLQGVLGLGLDVAADPLTYVEPLGLIHSPTQIAGHIADIAGEEAARALGRESISGAQLLAGEGAHLAEATPEQLGKLNDIRQAAEAAIEKVQKQGGISALSKDELVRYGTGPEGQQVLRKGLGLKFGEHELALTHGEGPLSELSKLKGKLGQKVGDALLGSEGEARGLGKLTGDAEQKALARSGLNPSERLQALTQTRLRATAQAVAQTTEKEVGKLTRAATKGASEDALASARDVINSGVEHADPKINDLAQRLSDAHQKIGELQVQKGLLAPDRLLPNGKYFPSPIDQTAREALVAAGLAPQRQVGLKAGAFFERGRTLFDEASGTGGIGQGENRISFSAGSRAVAERRAGEILATRLKAAAQVPGSVAEKFLAEHPDIAAQVEAGNVQLFQSPREALVSQARAIGRRAGQAHAGLELFRQGQGQLAPELAQSPLGRVAAEATPPTSTPQVSATGAGAPIPPDVPPPSAEAATRLSPASPEAGASPVPTPETGLPPTPTTETGAPPPSPEPPRPSTPEQTAISSYHETTTKAVAGLPPEVAGPLAQSDTLATLRTNPTISHQLANDTLQKAERIINAGIADDPVVAHATQIQKTVQEWQPLLDDPSPQVQEVARQYILAASHDVVGSDLPPSALEDFAHAIDANPEAFATLAKGQSQDYLKTAMLQPGIVTPADVADHITAMERVDPERLGKNYRKFIQWSKQWQLASPGQAQKILFGHLWNNSLADVGVGAEARSLRYLTQDVVDNPDWESVKSIVSKGQDIIEGLGGRTTKNPFSVRGPLVRASQNASDAAITWNRAAMALDTLEKGGTLNDAVARINKFHFNYGDLSETEQRLKQSVFPFFTFTKNNLPLQMEQLASNPKMFARFFHAKNEIESLSPADRIVPAYFANSLAIRLPWTQGGGHVNLLPNLPIKDIGLPLESLQGLTGPGDFGSRVEATLGPIVGQTAAPIAGIGGALLHTQLYNGVPLHGDRPVKLTDLHLPTWLNPVLRHLPLVSSSKGQLYMTESDAYGLEKIVPILARTRRLGGSNEPSMRNKQLASVASFFLGQQLRTNTTQDQAISDYIKSLETTRLKSISRRLAPGYKPGVKVKGPGRGGFSKKF